MSLHPQLLVPVPEETARVARAAYPKGNLYMRIRDELGTIYEDQMFAHLFPHCGQPAEAPWRLLLVCLLKDSPINKRRMRCEAGSIGSIC